MNKRNVLIACAVSVMLAVAAFFVTGAVVGPQVYAATPTTHDELKVRDFLLQSNGSQTNAQKLGVNASDTSTWKAFTFNGARQLVMVGNPDDYHVDSLYLVSVHGKLDLANCTALEEIYISHASTGTALTRVTELDVTNCTALTKMGLSSNRISSLDLSTNTALDYLYCYNNLLTSLDVSSNTKLKTLNCAENDITSLDFSNNPELEILHCFRNGLETLNVGNNTALTYLACSYNDLTELDVSNCPVLDNLNCQVNNLTSLDLSHNTVLSRLECHSNPFKSIKVIHAIPVCIMFVSYTHYNISATPLVTNLTNPAVGSYILLPQKIGNDWFATAYIDDMRSIEFKIIGSGSVPSRIFAEIIYDPLVDEFQIKFDINVGNGKQIVRYEEDTDTLTMDLVTPYIYSGGWERFSAQTCDPEMKITLVYGSSVTYNNTKGQANPNASEYEEGVGFSLQPLPDASGFKFNGWFDSASGGTQVTSITTFDTGPITLHAQWITVSNITYSNTKGAANPNPSTYDEGTGFSLQPLPNVTGFKFKGWFDSASGGTQVASITTSDTGSITLHAQWITVSSIIYNNTMGVSNSNPSTYDEGGTTFALIDLDDIDGLYLFLGWYDDEFAGNQVTEITSSDTNTITLWARWSAVLATHEVIYENTKGALNPNSATFVEGIGIAELLPLPSVTGFKFKGWYDSASGGNLVTSISADEDDDVTLHAQWTAVYDITYHEVKGANQNQSEYDEGESFTLDDLADVVGFKFKGWYTHATGGTKVTEILGDEGNLDLYAQWITISGVVYENVKGTNPNPEFYDEGVGFLLQDLADVPGFKFKGWYTFEEGGSKITSISISDTGTVTVWAQWITVSSIIYHDPNFADNPNPETYDEGIGIEELLDLELEGWIFLGWFLDPTEGDDPETSIPTDAKGEYSLYARWEAIETIGVVNYESDNPVVVFDNPNLAKPQVPGEVIELEDPTDYDKDVWEFIGWFNEEGTLIETVKVPDNGEVTVWARWRLKGSTQTNAGIDFLRLKSFPWYIAFVVLVLSFILFLIFARDKDKKKTDKKL